MSKRLVLFCAVFLALSSCGYSTHSALPVRLQAVYIEPFPNKINFTSEQVRNTYFPLLEVKVRNAVVKRYLFDGALEVTDKDKADVILKGELTGYDRYALRYTDNDDVQEYRVQLTVNLVLWDVDNNEEMWRENNFVGEATYFVSGPAAKSESAAVELAVQDLAKRVVERTVENW